MRSAVARRDSRYATRLNVRMSAQIRQMGSSHKFKVDIIDLSRTGFRCRTVFGLQEGQALSLSLPGYKPLVAVVAWSDGDVHGCAFEGGLHVAIFDHIVAHYRKD